MKEKLFWFGVFQELKLGQSSRPEPPDWELTRDVGWLFPLTTCRGDIMLKCRRLLTPFSMPFGAVHYGWFILHGNSRLMVQGRYLRFRDDPAWHCPATTKQKTRVWLPVTIKRKLMRQMLVQKEKGFLQVLHDLGEGQNHVSKPISSA